MTTIQMHGHTMRKANRSHTCWGCGKMIMPGERYWRCVVIIGDRVKPLKTCKDKCETIVDMIDQRQNAETANALLHPTLPSYIEKYPDAFKYDEG